MIVNNNMYKQIQKIKYKENGKEIREPRVGKEIRDRDDEVEIVGIRHKKKSKDQKSRESSLESELGRKAKSLRKLGLVMRVTLSLEFFDGIGKKIQLEKI